MLKSNLEPIEENDLDLESKIGIEKQNVPNEKINPFGNIEHEIPREISAAEKDGAYGKILAKVQTQANDDIDHSVVAADAEAGSLKMDAESQVQHLVDIATQKGVVHAVKVAQHMQDNYILDTFHDRMLGEELHDALVAKGMIKEL
ncbi:MAG: hypothetical protein US25_C0085G0001 [Candidatus Moranbacteria bacterium GW2011_GWE1_36_7]|nr:MAG: hypothetical protein UR99_C0002G0001 [Candidatus Moranbacteria bacterium GW2011_GWD2_36_12]KKQ07026.1 MAG: hypothetical protein US16_C0003G0001 [Candidatus Moranbacteria bacterium GW2011_GWE2_36_40]KKQ11421.1 MAG: hypothetical protein US25_C0085G0001 [Candidatus Moranbacteria bacterium GW2011_GWE1_36_7]